MPPTNLVAMLLKSSQLSMQITNNRPVMPLRFACMLKEEGKQKKGISVIVGYNQIEQFCWGVVVGMVGWLVVV